MDLDVRGWLRRHTPERLASHGGDKGDQPEIAEPAAYGGPPGGEPTILPEREAAAGPEPLGADGGNEP
jgi:hypothetical protein